LIAGIPGHLRFVVHQPFPRRDGLRIACLIHGACKFCVFLAMGTPFRDAISKRGSDGPPVFSSQLRAGSVNDPANAIDPIGRQFCRHRCPVPNDHALLKNRTMNK